MHVIWFLETLLICIQWLFWLNIRLQHIHNFAPISTGCYWHFVLRNQSAENRKSLGKITTLTFWRELIMSSYYLFLKNVCCRESNSQQKLTSFPIHTPAHTKGWGFRHIKMSWSWAEINFELQNPKVSVYCGSEAVSGTNQKLQYQ